MIRRVEIFALMRRVMRFKNKFQICDHKIMSRLVGEKMGEKNDEFYISRTKPMQTTTILFSSSLSSRPPILRNRGKK